MTVDVFIREERNITKLRAPEIQSGNEVDPDLENKGNKRWNDFLKFFTKLIFLLLNRQ